MDNFTPFEVGDLIRLRYSDERFLVLVKNNSFRTGNTISYKVLDLKRSDYITISYRNFDDYALDIK